jgi:hypothetical protein
MDVLLLAITGISFAVALVMSVAAWRVSREQRARSAARVAALAAAAQGSDNPAHPQIRAARVAASESVALADDTALPFEQPRLAVGHTRPWARPSVATRRDERPPAAHDVFPTEAPPTEPATRIRHDVESSHAFLESAVPRAGAPTQRRLAIAAGLVLAVALGGAYFTIYGNASASPGVAAAGQTAAPLELVSLRHERRGGQLAITGLVRNPRSGTAVEQLVAVVFLFDQQGGFLTSARAGVDFRTLGAGDESPFVIALDAPLKVARYRVSFRTDRGVVPHVDRRGQEPIARELP